MNLANYQIWQGKKIRELLDNLDEEEFSQKLEDPLKSIQELCVHITLALEYCFIRRDKSSKSLKEIQDELISKNKGSLLERWEELDLVLHEAIMNRDENLLIEITGIHPDPYMMPELDYYLQYIVHTSTHRGQIMMSLRKLGKETKNLDYILYFGDK